MAAHNANAIAYRELGNKSAFWILFLVSGAIAAAGIVAHLVMEHHGHVITGMDNRIVWGLPHVFAVFLIVAASGALNVSSTASVFGKSIYKPLAPLSGLVSLCLLAGGLAVLVLDLGRSDRMIVAATQYNFKSIFAWNIFLYTGFYAVVGVYLWLMLEKRLSKYSHAAGLTAFVWRLVLTTGTGSIFGFLIAREAYQSAIMAPMFITYSLAYGTAIYLIVLISACAIEQRPLGDEVLRRLKNLTATFVAASLYFAAAHHLTNLYFTRNHAVEAFILMDGGVITQLFWLGQVAVGGVLPLTLLLAPGATRTRIVAACVAVVAGGLAQMYVTIIGGQAWPMDLFPGYQAASSFSDGEIHQYTPGAWEVLLAVSGLAIALLLIVIVLRALRVLPERMGDADLDPAHQAT